MNIEKSSETVLKVCMGLKKGERVLVITDKTKIKIGNSLLKKAQELGAEAKLIIIPVGNVSGEEPPKDVAKKMLDYDIILMPTTESLSHTNARKKACERGARIASMPGITEDMMKRTLNADYSKIKERTKRIAKYLDAGKTVRVTTKKGTDITFNIKGRRTHCTSGGIFHTPGDWGNLPEGEACIGPVEGKTNGVFVVDAAMADLGKVKKLKITVKDGYATKIEGDKAKELIKMIDRVGPESRNIAELGIGTNDKAKITGITLEDEKVMGTAHIALGNNIALDGKVDVKIHVDGVFRKPTISVDGKVIMEKGKVKNLS